MKPSDTLRQERAAVITKMDDLLRGVGNEFTGEQRNLHNRLEGRIKDFDTKIQVAAQHEERTRAMATDQINAGLADQIGSDLPYSSIGRRFLHKGESMRSLRGTALPEYQNPELAEPQSLGKFLRGVVTGRWDGAAAEKRSLQEGAAGLGGYLLEDPISDGIIDRVRNQTQLLKAGAVTFPMTTLKQDWARQLTDPTVAWKAENDAIVETDLTFDRVESQARVVAGLVRMSIELFEDVASLSTFVENAIAEAIAVELDRVGLVGSGSAPEPLGILGTSGVAALSMGDPDGAALTSFDPISNAVQDLQEANVEPETIIYAPRTAGTLDRLKDTTNQPLTAPESFTKLSKLVTNQIPIDATKGASTDASYAFLGGFKDNVVLGLRTGVQIEVFRAGEVAGESILERMQVAIRCYLRADWVVQRPSKLLVINGITP